MAASPDQIQLRTTPQTRSKQVAPQDEEEVLWVEQHVDTGLSNETIDDIRRKMRGKRIQMQDQLKKWFETAPWRIGCVRAYHEFTDAELQYIKTHHKFWTLKRWRRLFGCLLETDNPKRRRSSRREKRQPTRSARDCFINMVSRRQGILHTTHGGQTTAPGMGMANLLRDVGRQEVDTYDRGNRILWRLPNGHIVCTTKRALKSMQTEQTHNVSEALIACKRMVKSEMHKRRKRGADTHRTERLRKRPRKNIRRMTTADVMETENTIAMVAITDSKKKCRLRPARMACAAMGISLKEPEKKPTTTFVVSASKAEGLKQKRATPRRRKTTTKPRVVSVYMEQEDDSSSDDEHGGAYMSSSSEDEDSAPEDEGSTD